MLLELDRQYYENRLAEIVLLRETIRLEDHKDRVLDESVTERLLEAMSKRNFILASRVMDAELILFKRVGTLRHSMQFKKALSWQNSLCFALVHCGALLR